MKVKSIPTDLNTVKKRLQHDVLLDQLCCLILYYRQLAKVASVVTTVASLQQQGRLRIITSEHEVLDISLRKGRSLNILD